MPIGYGTPDVLSTAPNGPLPSPRQARNKNGSFGAPLGARGTSRTEGPRAVSRPETIPGSPGGVPTIRMVGNMIVYNVYDNNISFSLSYSTFSLALFLSLSRSLARSLSMSFSPPPPLSLSLSTDRHYFL